MKPSSSLSSSPTAAFILTAVAGNKTLRVYYIAFYLCHGIVIITVTQHTTGIFTFPFQLNTGDNANGSAVVEKHCLKDTNDVAVAVHTELAGHG